MKALFENLPDKLTKFVHLEPAFVFAEHVPKSAANPRTIKSSAWFIVKVTS